jgi:hypothetical protein
LKKFEKNYFIFKYFYRTVALIHSFNAWEWTRRAPKGGVCFDIGINGGWA